MMMISEMCPQSSIIEIDPRGTRRLGHAYATADSDLRTDVIKCCTNARANAQE